MTKPKCCMSCMETESATGRGFACVLVVKYTGPWRRFGVQQVRADDQVCYQYSPLRYLHVLTGHQSTPGFSLHPPFILSLVAMCRVGETTLTQQSFPLIAVLTIWSHEPNLDGLGVDLWDFNGVKGPVIM